MTSRPLVLEADATRKRKAHRKSRQGCSNCKLRRVKCDETKPKCNKCIDYGVSCNYNAKGYELEPRSQPGTGAFQVLNIGQYDRSKSSCTTVARQSLPAKALSSYPACQLDAQDLELLRKFQIRTGHTIGTRTTSKIFAEDALNLSFKYPYLLHVILTFTLRHDRFLSAAPGSKPSTSEAYHWYMSTSRFNDVLSKPIQPSERDALWATACVLGATAFSCLETNSPEAAWPLRPRDTTDLDWLKMSEGKRAVQKIAKPERKDSVFYPIHEGSSNLLEPNDPKGSETFESLPSGLLDLYNLGHRPSNENPYFRALSILSRVIHLECNHDTILRFLSFIGYMDPAFKTLVEEKDPRALLIMCFWFAKVCRYQQWWVWRRSVMECQAIILYLEKYHSHESDIIRLLSYPKTICGLFDHRISDAGLNSPRSDLLYDSKMYSFATLH